MTIERDPQTRLVLSWLREDAHENAERVLLSALDEVDTTRQRRSIWPAWSGLRVNRLALSAAAAMVAVVVVGYTLLPRVGILGPGATPASSSSVPSLPVGTHLMDPVGVEHGEDRVIVTIPAPGWFAPDTGSLTKDLGGGDRATIVLVPGDHYSLPRSSCNWQIDDADARGNHFPATAADFVAFVAAQPYDWPGGSRTRAFADPVAITVDGVPGQRIVNTVRAYPDGDASACDEQRFCSIQDRDGWGCLLSHPEPGALDTLWVVGSGEKRSYYLVVASSGSPGPALRAEMNALVGSMTFVVE